MRKENEKEMVAVRNEAMAWNRKAGIEGKSEMKIDLKDAIKSRQKATKPMKQMRGLARELREGFGM